MVADGREHRDPGQDVAVGLEEAGVPVVVLTAAFVVYLPLLALLARRLTNDEVARELHVSQTTVKSHLASVMRRLEVRSRTQLAVLVNRHQ